MKRILTVQDISCIGKCSLTVALPVLSVMGLEAVVLPTMLLSAHTAFPGVFKRDLTEIILPVTKHWMEQGIQFDSVSCGYLGSLGQVDLLAGLCREWKKEKAVIFVDPVMGDGGKLYSGFGMEYVGAMKKLCMEADVILPNLTEAAFLLDMDYSALPTKWEDWESLLVQLSKLNNGTVVLKGVGLREGRTMVLAYCAKTEKIVCCERELLPIKPSGTGDIFAAVCQGAITKGICLEEAIGLAMDFVLECICKTMEDKEGRWYGVNYEEAFPFLIEKMKR